MKPFELSFLTHIFYQGILTPKKDVIFVVFFDGFLYLLLEVQKMSFYLFFDEFYTKNSHNFWRPYDTNAKTFCRDVKTIRSPIIL